jgi:hypothetical protein
LTFQVTVLRSVSILKVGQALAQVMHGSLVVTRLSFSPAMKNTQFFAQNPLRTGLFFGPDGPRRLV